MRLCFLLLLSVVFAPAADRPPNIVLIMADDLGLGHLGAYGGRKIETPHIDRLAAQGMLFRQAYAGSTVCAPSRSVLLQGLHGGHTSVRGNLGDAYIADEDATLAEVLRDAGYATGGYGKWGLGLVDSPGSPLRQGFDDFLGYLHQVHAHFFYPTWLTLNYGRMNLRLNENGGRGQFSHDLIVDRALDFMRKNRDRPFFAYMPVTIPHVELAVPRESLNEYLGRWPEPAERQEPRVGYIVSPNPRATIAAMISHLDRDVGRVVSLIDQLGLAEDTVVIFNSDNGAQSNYDVNEEFFRAALDLRGFKGAMYEGGLRIPQIVRWTGRIQPGTETEHPTYFPDMMPTFADLAEYEGDLLTDGLSFVPTLLRQGEQETHDWMYWELINSSNEIVKQGARNGRWKFVRDPYDEPVEVYDLEADPREQADLAADRQDLVRSFEDWLKANRTEPPDQPERQSVGYTDYVEIGPGPGLPSVMGNRNWPKDEKP